MKRAVVTGLAVLAAVIVLVGTNGGMEYNNDAREYAEAAANDLRVNGEALTIFPPGYPIVLSVADPETSARWVNAACAAALVVLAYLLARRHASEGFAVGAAAFVAIAPTLHATEEHVWSEPLFNVLAVAALLMFDRMLERSTSRVVVAAALLTGLAYTCRYAGASLIVTGLVVAIVCRRGWLFAGTAALLPLAVTVRNLAEGAGPLGDREPSPFAIGEVLYDFGGAVVSWPLDGHAPTAVRAAIVVVLVGLAAFGAARNWGNPPWVAGGFVLVYTVYLIASELVTDIDSVNGRLTSPLVVPAVAVVVWGLDRLWRASTPSAPTHAPSRSAG